MRFRLIFALLLAPLSVTAQQNSPLEAEDFAYGFPLEVDGDGALYSFDLPEAVYRHSTRVDLGDMRIFNGYGEVVPLLLKPGVEPHKTRREPVELRFFPLYDESDSTDSGTQIHIATDESGAVVDLWQRGPSEQKQVIKRYLIDASGLEWPMEKLLLDWGKPSGSFLESVSVEYSDDLHRWETLDASFTLAALNYQGHRLGQQEIALPALETKYLRISWPLDDRGIQLRSVKAEVLRKGDEVPRRRLKLQPSGEGAPHGVHEFETGGHYPVDRLQLHLPQGNTVVQAKLFSRSEEKEAAWQLRHQGLFYNLTREGYTLHNDVVRLPAISDPHWRLEVETDGGGIGRGTPRLELGWVPHRLYFVTRGETPFSLAFGAANIEPSRSDLGPLLDKLQQGDGGSGFIKSATTGSLYELGGERRLKPAPPPLPWKKWLLWSVLVLGVLLLVFMARSLYRQMSGSERTV
ncbi:MAG: DUF3999 domain-containing protein [Pseudomonadota bacterium]